MKLFFRKYWLILLSCVWMGCEKKTVQTDSITSGRMIVLTDESYYPLLKAEVDAFQSLYDQVKIQLEVMPQEAAVSRFLKGNADMIITSRDLTGKEKEYIRNKKWSSGSNKIATDAVALVMNQSYPDSMITLDILKQIVEGAVTKWNELNPSLPQTDIEMVVDKSSSGNLSFLMEKLNLKFDKVKVYAAGSNEKVLNLVKENNNQLGVIGANWISDEDDPRLEEKLKGIKVLAVGEGKQGVYLQPVQENLWDMRYPLSRPVYCISKTVNTNVVAGFTSFMMSDPGQRIILKEGLLPAVMPEREIVIVKK